MNSLTARELPAAPETRLGSMRRRLDEAHDILSRIESRLNNMESSSKNVSAGLQAVSQVTGTLVDMSQSIDTLLTRLRDIDEHMGTLSD